MTEEKTTTYEAWRESWERHMDWYEDGYCPKCDETWNIDSHAWYCPTCDTKMIEKVLLKKERKNNE